MKIDRLLQLGFYEVVPECAGPAVQIVDGRYYMPRKGKETLQMIKDNFEAHQEDTADRCICFKPDSLVHEQCPVHSQRR